MAIKQFAIKSKTIVINHNIPETMRVVCNAYVYENLPMDSPE